MPGDNKKHTPESVAAKVARALLKAAPSKKKPVSVRPPVKRMGKP